jgi:hypothetical protein
VVDAELQRSAGIRGAEPEFWGMLAAGFVTVVGHWVVAGLDVGRFHWSARAPRLCQSRPDRPRDRLGLVFASLLVNRFFSPVVRSRPSRRIT